MEQRQQKPDDRGNAASNIPYRGLPPGFVGLKPDLGGTLRTRRKEGGYGKQAVIAAAIGIAVESLSRIESNRAVPRPDTLDALLTVLELGWEKVAFRDHRAVVDEASTQSRRRDRMLDAGRELREARVQLGMTLRDLAARSGLSLAQLSRVESGQSGGRRVYDTHPDDVALPRDERRIIFSNPILADLVSRSHEPRS